MIRSVDGEASVSAAVRTVLFLFHFEPLIVIFSVTSMATVLAPNNQFFTETSLTNNTQQIALALPLRDRRLA